jgi:acyl-coenzyme A thioesterase PaaI-like protein
LTPAKEGPFTCPTETFHRTRHLVFVRADILDVRDNPIGSAQPTFRIIKMDFV